MGKEKRLISLDDAIKATHSEIYWTESQQAAVRSFLVKQPKADAVEVVRCKDCKYEKTCSILWESKEPKENGYCSLGERKDDGTA